MFGFILVLAVFGGLIWLFVWSIKRAKRKFIEQKEKMEEQKRTFNESEEQKASDAESKNTAQSFSQDESATDAIPVKSKENTLTNILITIIAIPLNLFIGWILPGLANMDTPTWLSKLFGYKTKKCRYCSRYFNSVSYFCKHSPNRRHRE